MKRLILLAIVTMLTIAGTASAQRRRTVTSTPCTAKSIEFSDDWRRSTTRYCGIEGEELRCWQNALNGEPLWTARPTDPSTGEEYRVPPAGQLGNMSCRLISQWYEQTEIGDYAKYIASEWVKARDRGEDPGYDVPMPQCTYHGYTFEIQESESTRGVWAFRIWEKRDPKAWSWVTVPVQIDDGDGNLVPWPGHGKIDAAFQSGCYRDPDWIIDIEGVTITHAGKIGVTANE